MGGDLTVQVYLENALAWPGDKRRQKVNQVSLDLKKKSFAAKLTGSLLFFRMAAAKSGALRTACSVLAKTVFLLSRKSL